MDSCTIYCKICARKKLVSELYNLEQDEQTLRSIIEKLNRLNAKVDFESLCPKMVCSCCISSLDSAYEFVIGVENGQKLLNSLISVHNIEKEQCLSDCETLSDKTEVAVNEVKEEYPEYNEGVKDFLMVKIETDEREHLYIQTTDVHNTISDDQSKMPIDNSSDIKKRKKGSKENCNKITTCNEPRKFSNGAENVMTKVKALTWDDYSWMCSVCETIYEKSEELIQHSMEEHNRCNAFCCTICHIRRNCLKSMVNHIYSHNAKLLLSCFKCGETFTDKNKMKGHKKVHRLANCYCKSCQTPFDDKSELIKHEKMYRVTGYIKKEVDNGYQICDICGKRLHSSSLVAHKKLHNDPGYECKICKKVFKSIVYLREHIARHDDLRPFACDQCEKAFRSKGHLNTHKLIHMDAYPHKCNLCEKSFRYNYGLKNHIMLHKGIYPYSCAECHRGFTNNSNYFKHMLRRHKIDIRKPKPEISDKDFTEWKEKIQTKRVIKRKGNSERQVKKSQD